MRLLGEFVYFFYEDILHTKKACKAPKQRLLRYLLIGQFIYLFLYEDILHTKKAYKALRQRLLRYSYTTKSIIKHTGDFHLDIAPRSIKKSKRLFTQIF